MIFPHPRTSSSCRGSGKACFPEAMEKIRMGGDPDQSLMVECPAWADIDRATTEDRIVVSPHC
jgi:hypothetical protein